MDEHRNSKSTFVAQNVQLDGIVESLGLEELTNSSEDTHCSKHTSANILNEIANLSPRLQNGAENSFEHLESNAHSLLSDGNVLEVARTLQVSEFSNGDNAHLEIEQVGNINENRMLLDSHYYNVLGYDLSQPCVGAFEALIIGSTVKPAYKDGPKVLERQTQQNHYLQNNVLITDPTYCEVPVNQYQEHDNNLCNSVAEICSENSSQIILESQCYEKDVKLIELSQQISDEFQFDISNSLNESAETNDNQVHLSAAFSPTNDAASEVAFTLANLRNMETHHDIPEVCENLVIDNSKFVITSNVDETSESSRKIKKLNETTMENSIIEEATSSELVNTQPQKRSRLVKQSIETAKREKSSNNSKENLMGKLIIASEQCEPESLIPEGVVDDVIPAVGYRIMDMYNLSEMVYMMHNCTAEQKGPVVIQEQVSQRKGAVSHISLICTGCQEGTVCPTSNKLDGKIGWDINSRVEKLKKQFNIKEMQLQRMLEILGIFYRPSIRQGNLAEPVKIKKTTGMVAKKVVPAKKLRLNGKPKVKVQKTTNSVKEKTHECSVCKKKFFYPHHLKNHMSVHNRENHTCPYCHVYFKKKYNLQEHIKKHENVKYECNLCSREYTDRSTLMKHMSSFHEEKFIIECEFCAKKFYHRVHYNEHKRIHTKQTPFICNICGKKFRYQNSAKKHMCCHSQPKFKCTICCKHYRWLVTARHHVATIHEINKDEVDSHISENSNESEQFCDEILQSQATNSDFMENQLSDVSLLNQIGSQKGSMHNRDGRPSHKEVDIEFSKEEFLCDQPVNQTNEVFIF